MKKKLLGIYGAGGAAKELYEMIIADHELSGRWEKIIFIDDTQAECTYRNCECIPFEIFCNRYAPDRAEIVISLGEPKYRKLLFDRVKDGGYSLPTIISSMAVVSPTAVLEEGVVIKRNAIVSTDAHLGRNCLVNSYGIIGHDVVIGECCQISSFAAIAGHTKVGDCVFIGVSASVRENLTVGDNVIVSMGAVVLRDVNPDRIVMGNPAREIAQNSEQKVFK